jgi:hypothetical protein
MIGSLTSAPQPLCMILIPRSAVTKDLFLALVGRLSTNQSLSSKAG